MPATRCLYSTIEKSKNSYQKTSDDSSPIKRGLQKMFQIEICRFG